MGGGKRPAALDKRIERGIPPEPRAAPWLMIPYQEKGSYKHHQAFYNICEPNNKSYRKSIPKLSYTTIYQKPSHQGWLIVLCNDETYNYAIYTPKWKYGDCFLWNPVTSEMIQLPTFLDWFDDSNDYEVIDCVLSSPPGTTNTSRGNMNKNDSVVLFVLRPFEWQDDQEYEHVCFLYCRPGEKQWRTHKFFRDNGTNLSEFQSVVCFKGKLYVMGRNSHHQEIEVNDDLSISIKTFRVKYGCIFPLIGGIASIPSNHYVETPEQLFKVIRRQHNRIDSDKEVVTIEVTRLNFSLMEWEKVNSFGEHVIFVGSYTTTAYCLADELGLSSGCLYYLLPEDRSLYKFQVESTSSTVMLPCLQLPTPWYTAEWIMMLDNKKGREKNILSKREENHILTALELKTGNISVNDADVASYWDILTGDIVDLIAASYLHGLDYKNFRSVCKANRSILPTVNPTSLLLSPWLVFSRDHNYTIYSLVNPVYNNEDYIMRLSDIDGCTIRFQKGGWLLMTKAKSIFFYNPFTREMVKLPDMNKGYYCYSVVSCFSLPTSSDCVVFTMDHRNYYEKVYVDFIKRGEEQWSSFIFDNTNTERYMPLLNTAVFHDGAFFCVDYNGTLGVFTVKDNSWKVLEKPHKQFDTQYPSFLVECGGDLLLVKLGGLWGTVRVFRLNFSVMEWVIVKSLGEYMLFISHTSCLSAVAPNSNMKNKIYFPRLHMNDGRIIFYSLDTRSYHSLGSQHSSKDLYDTEGWFTNCTWIQPNMLKSTSRELDWLKTPF